MDELSAQIMKDNYDKLMRKVYYESLYYERFSFPKSVPRTKGTPKVDWKKKIFPLDESDMIQLEEDLMAKKSTPIRELWLNRVEEFKQMNENVTYNAFLELMLGLFKPEVMLMYNYTGRKKRSFQTSPAFNHIFVSLFQKNKPVFKEMIMKFWRKAYMMIKRKNYVKQM